MFGEKRNMTELGNLISPAQNEKCGDNEYPVLSMTMHQGLVLQSDKFKKTIASKDRSEYKVVHRGQLVVSFPIDEGVLAAQRIVDAGIVSPAYNIWNIDQDAILPHFLEYALRCDRAIDYYKSRLRGSTARRRSLPKESFLQFRVPVPSISEQRHILHVLQTMEEILRVQKQQLAALDTLIKARFVEMFGTEKDVEKWPSCTVEDVADVCVGVVIKPTQYYTSDGIPAFRSLNVGEMTVKDENWVYFSEEGHQKNQKSVIRENDVLVVRSGAPGKACVASKKYAGYNAVDIIIAHPKEVVNPTFLAMFTNMPHGMNQIREKTGGAAQQHFNVGGYKKLNLILPPLELQNNFAAFVSEVDKLKAVVQKALDETQLLFDSLMQEYFG